MALGSIRLKESEGYILVDTDGSSEYLPTVGWIWGWGCHSSDGWELASHLPHTRQTINQAELQAVIEEVVYAVSF